MVMVAPLTIGSVGGAGGRFIPDRLRKGSVQLNDPKQQKRARAN
jgi:hypothetical protein